MVAAVIIQPRQLSVAQPARLRIATGADCACVVTAPDASGIERTSRLSLVQAALAGSLATVEWQRLWLRRKPSAWSAAEETSDARS